MQQYITHAEVQYHEYGLDDRSAMQATLRYPILWVLQDTIRVHETLREFFERIVDRAMEKGDIDETIWDVKEEGDTEV